MKQYAIWFGSCALLLFASIGIGAGELKGVGPVALTNGSTLNVRDFGARGDGRTDDTKAFQTALGQFSRGGGGIVEVPSGKYLIKTHLVIPESVTLEGNWRAPATYRDDTLGESGPGWYRGGKVDW